MGNKRKGFSKKRDQRKVQIKKKKNKNSSTERPVNKKALFNRYKDKQKVLELLEKKRKFEEKQSRIVYSSESEEEDPVCQLLATFGDKKVLKSDIRSDQEESECSNSEHDASSIDVDVDSGSNANLNTKKKEISSESESDAEDRVQELLTTQDPFSRHIHCQLSDSLLIAVSSKQMPSKQQSIEWPHLGKILLTIPQPIENNSMKKPALLLQDDTQYSKPGTLPTLISEVDYENLSIHTRLRSRISVANKDVLVRNVLEENDILTPMQRELFSIVNNYQDLYYPETSWKNIDELRLIYCMHAANHAIKSRAIITRNDTEISQKKLTDTCDGFRDQGVVRPTILILVPFRSSALKIVKLLGTLISGENGELGNGQRFQEEFASTTLQLPKTNPKPEDYELLFSGNTDDNFRLGMAVTKKTLKLYTDFYSSDIIIASPLGLRTLLGAEGEKDRDYDFLNSLELVIMDQTEVLLMQNWEHVLHVFQHMHLQPQSVRNTDFSRVREWAVNGWVKYYRQTLIFSSIDIPEIWSIMTHYSSNYAGRARIMNTIEEGCIKQVALTVPQFFHRFCTEDPISSVESRFEYFIKEIIPRQSDPLMGHTMVYVPSYFDFVRLRNYFKKEDVSFVQICEYSKDNKVARARDMFFHSETRYLLYTERAHFYHRRRIKGIRHLIFYQPPTLPNFYSEMINLMQEANQNKYGGSECNMSVTTLHCKYDSSRLAALIGTQRAANMLGSQQNTHMLITGQ